MNGVKKRVKANRKDMDLDWNNDTETILAQFVKIINEVLDGTDYYAQRNSTIGEKNIDIFKKGVSGRVGHLWPRKREQIIHANFTVEIVEQLGQRMQLPPDSDVKEGRYLKWRAFRGVSFKTAMAMINEQYIRRNKQFCVVGICKDGKSALEYLNENRVDLIVLDVFMLHTDGFETLRQIRKAKVPVDVIMVTAANDRSIASWDYRLSSKAIHI